MTLSELANSRADRDIHVLVNHANDVFYGPFSSEEEADIFVTREVTDLSVSSQMYQGNELAYVRDYWEECERDAAPEFRTVDQFYAEMVSERKSWDHTTGSNAEIIAEIKESVARKLQGQF